MKTLEGKVAVITGGSSGIGLATAKRFVDEGAHVVITGRREKELKEAAAFIKRNVTTVVGDVSRLEDLDRLYAVVKEKHGHITFSSRTRARGRSHRSRWLPKLISTRPST
jgi:NAD(P)-dependent dehydrogenase (short-subunit alcohol dehydrogenase family)